MISLQGFYSRHNVQVDGVKALVEVHILRDHDLFKGHFPNMPVAPGAAITQMVIDEAENVLGNVGVFAGAKQIKFLAVLNPDTASALVLEYQFSEVDGQKHYSCVGRSADIIFFKMNGLFH